MIYDACTRNYRMARRQRILLVFALLGWTGAVFSQLIASTAAASDRERWETHRNQCMLVGSLATNTLVFTTLYRLLVQWRHLRTDC